MTPPWNLGFIFLNKYFSKHHGFHWKTLICPTCLNISKALNLNLSLSGLKKGFNIENKWECMLCTTVIMNTSKLPLGATKFWSDISLRMTMTQINRIIQLFQHKDIILPSPGKTLKTNSTIDRLEKGS